MYERSVLPLVAIVCVLASVFLAVDNIAKQASPSTWWLPLLLFLIGGGAAMWGWLSERFVHDAPEPVEPINPAVKTDSVSAVKEVAIADAVEVVKAPDTTELMPSVDNHLGLSAEEMAILKPPTTRATTSFDEKRMDDAVRKAEATRAQKEKDETLPTNPTRPEKPIAPIDGLSAEEIAIQKPATPHTTERLDDKTLDEAIAKAKARADKKLNTPLSAEQMAAEKPETPAITRKISRSMLPPTSTSEMATKKPSTEVSTSEMASTVEVEAAPENALSPETEKMADEKPATPLSTLETSVEPGALPIDTPLIDIPSPATQVMEVEAAPSEFDLSDDDEQTVEITPMEIAAEGALNEDDLQRIEGIGPKIAALLIGEGISTFSRLATTPEEELREILKKGRLRLAPTIDTWAEQAALAARGDWDALKKYQDEMGKFS
jgi:predicted flap endonuclease-1-like 5' DNA nuclease